MLSPGRDIGANYEQVGASHKGTGLANPACTRQRSGRGRGALCFHWRTAAAIAHPDADCTAERQRARAARDAQSLMHPTTLPLPTQLVPHGPPSR